MPRLKTWGKLPPGIRQHLMDRMRDRSISIPDLNKLRIWAESNPLVPEGEWYKYLGSFKICGEGLYPKTFLLAAQPARGESV